MILTTTDGQKNLPRYLATAFSIAKKGKTVTWTLFWTMAVCFVLRV